MFYDYNLYNGKPLPDYYPTMYLDGYSPAEIMVAHHRTMLKKFMAQRNAKPDEIKITSEVKLK